MAYLNEGKAMEQENEWLPEILFKGEWIEIVAEEMGKLNHYSTALRMEEDIWGEMAFKNLAYLFMLPFLYKWIWQCLTEVETLQ